MGSANVPDRSSVSDSGVQTPWPQMGVLVDSAVQGPFKAQRSVGVLSSSAAPVRYSAPVIEASPTHLQADGELSRPPLPADGELSRPPLPAEDSPYLAPAQPVAFGQAQVRKRRGGVGLIVVGLVTSFLLAPLSMVVYMVVGADLVALSARMQPLTVSQSVSVDASGGFLVMALGAGTADACALVDGSGQTHRLEVIPGAQPAWWASGLAQGQYSLSCDVSGDPGLVGATGIDPQSVSAQANYAMLFSTAVGVVGLVMVVIGARQRARR